MGISQGGRPRRRIVMVVVTAILACGLVWLAWKDVAPKTGARVDIDYLGGALLTAGGLSLLLGLNELGTPLGWGCLVAAVGLFAGLAWAEKRAPDPILPLHLFKDRLFSVSILHGVFSGWAMFGSITYVPLFVQAVLGTSATQAGITLTPSSLAWTVASIFGGRLLLKMGYRTLSLIGMVILVAGTFFMSQIGVGTSQFSIMLYTSMMGMGMGLAIPAFLIAVQSTVSRQSLGVATSTLQFSRSIGGTLGVSILGVFLSSRLASQLLAAGVDPTSISLNTLLDPIAGANIAFEGPLRQALAVSIAGMFIIAFIAAFAALGVVAFAPPGKIAQLMQQRLPDQPVED